MSSADKDQLTDEKIRDLYRNPATGLVGFTKFYPKVRALYPDAKRAYVKRIYEEIATRQIHRLPIRSGVYPLLAHEAFERIQIDLMDMSSESMRTNHGMKWIFCAIDVYSRYAFAYPQKTKNQADCVNSLENMMDNIVFLTSPPGMFTVKQLDSDNEASFKGGQFAKYCKSVGIEQNLNQPGDIRAKGVVERFNRTLRGYIGKYQTSHQSMDWVDVLPEVINNYNNTVHSTLRSTPKEAVTTGGITDYISRQTAKAERMSPETVFQVGDKVRMLIRKKIFEKHRHTYTKTLHKITSVELPLFYVSDRKEGYKSHELQKVSETAENLENKEQDRQRLYHRQDRRVAREGLSLDSLRLVDVPRNSGI